MVKLFGYEITTKKVTGKNRAFYLRFRLDAKTGWQYYRYLYLDFCFFNIEGTVKIGEYIHFFWEESFLQYFSRNDIKEKINNLKSGMDKISCEYVDHFANMLSYCHCYKKEAWTKYDLKLMKKLEAYNKGFRQPVPGVLYVDPFYYLMTYGLRDLPEKVYNKINGRTIVQGGGWDGGTAFMFHYHFPKSKIDLYGPLGKYKAVLEELLRLDDCDNKIFYIDKILGGKEAKKRSDKSEDTKQLKISTIDEEYKNKTEKIGLIKLDSESFETITFEASKEIIKRDKPVICIAMYHTPYDFFELKEKIEHLNLGYKFMVRRSCMPLPSVDLVLIAYVEEKD